MGGKADLKVRRSDAPVIVGPMTRTVKKPIAVIRRGEIAEYVNAEFWQAFELWQSFHYTRTLPFYGKGLYEHPQHIVDIIVTLERENDYLDRIGKIERDAQLWQSLSKNYRSSSTRKSRTR